MLAKDCDGDSEGVGAKTLPPLGQRRDAIAGQSFYTRLRKCSHSCPAGYLPFID